MNKLLYLDLSSVRSVCEHSEWKNSCWTSAVKYLLPKEMTVILLDVHWPIW